MQPSQCRTEPADSADLRELFDRMTAEELEAYADEGQLPDWFMQAFSASGKAARAAPAKRKKSGGVAPRLPSSRK